VLDHKGYHYLLLTGSTAVDERQGLVDEFNEDENCKVFLLSTKAGMLLPVQLRLDLIEIQAVWELILRRHQ
jgi:hypothetical protein